MSINNNKTRQKEAQNVAIQAHTDSMDTQKEIGKWEIKISLKHLLFALIVFIVGCAAGWFDIDSKLSSIIITQKTMIKKADFNQWAHTTELWNSNRLTLPRFDGVTADGDAIIIH